MNRPQTKRRIEVIKRGDWFTVWIGGCAHRLTDADARQLYRSAGAAIGLIAPPNGQAQATLLGQHHRRQS